MSIRSRWAVLFLGATVLSLTAGRAGADVFLDVTSLAPGTPGGPARGSFAGTLGGVTVTGSLAAGSGGLDVNLTPPGTAFDSSVINNTSPQYSYSGIYTPSQNNVDQIGYDLFFPSVSDTRLLSIAFSSAVTNPVFHVANLDSMVYDFSPTTTAANLALVSGNGGGGDGLGLVGTVLQDLNPATAIALPPGTTPPTSGARSGYGSLEILGTYNTLLINLRFNPGAITGDGGSFTISAPPATPIPEPATLVPALSGVALLGLAYARRRWRSAA